jgi:excinuclease ABC subunit A
MPRIFPEHAEADQDGKDHRRADLKEIRERLGFLVNVGLDYLTLDRHAGIAFRRRVAAHPAGDADRVRAGGRALHSRRTEHRLHQRDNDKLIATLERLRDLGNTVIVVEHDEETIRTADHVIDLGPGAGVHGGEIVAQGTPKQIWREEILTASFLRANSKSTCRKAPAVQRQGDHDHAARSTTT